jgi:hypothetical protein
VFIEWCGGGSGSGRLFIAERRCTVDAAHLRGAPVHRLAIGQLGRWGSVSARARFSGERLCAGTSGRAREGHRAARCLTRCWCHGVAWAIVADVAVLASAGWSHCTRARRRAKPGSVV